MKKETHIQRQTQKLCDKLGIKADDGSITSPSNGIKIIHYPDFSVKYYVGEDRPIVLGVPFSDSRAYISITEQCLADKILNQTLEQNDLDGTDFEWIRINNMKSEFSTSGPTHIGYIACFYNPKKIEEFYTALKSVGEKFNRTIEKRVEELLQP